MPDKLCRRCHEKPIAPMERNYLYCEDCLAFHERCREQARRVNGIEKGRNKRRGDEPGNATTKGKALFSRRKGLPGA